MTPVRSRLAIEPVAPDDETALREWFALEAAAQVVDRPDDPPPTWAEHRVALRNPRPGLEASTWLARAGGAVVGAVGLSLPTLDNLDNAWVDLVVAPGCRRDGIGRALLAHVAGLARERGRSRLVGHVHEPLNGTSPGAVFAASAGASHALANQRRRLTVPVPDEAGLARLRDHARTAAAGGLLTRAMTGGTPEKHLDDVARLIARMSTDAPLGDLHQGPEHYDAQRIRDNDTARRARGSVLVATVAQEDATGRLVAFTGMNISVETDWHAWQDDTIVDPPHRG
ncbi:MAG: GNAT family N-acetyltransferase, partial [Pseudonocardia sp.]